MSSLGEAVTITVENSAHPLRLFSLLGLLLGALNLLYIFYVAAIYLLRDEVVEGWTTLSLQVSGLFMFVILMLSAMSEYIGRVLQNVQGKPAYHIRLEKSGPPALAEDELNIADSAMAEQPEQDTAV